jgi:hypothetical protein
MKISPCIEYGEEVVVFEDMQSASCPRGLRKIECLCCYLFAHGFRAYTREAARRKGVGLGPRLLRQSRGVGDLGRDALFRTESAAVFASGIARLRGYRPYAARSERAPYRQRDIIRCQLKVSSRNYSGPSRCPLVPTSGHTDGKACDLAIISAARASRGGSISWCGPSSG